MPIYGPDGRPIHSALQRQSIMQQLQEGGMELRNREGNPIQCNDKDRSHMYMGRCEICDNKIVLHCEDCKEQITACRCTLERRAQEQAAEEEKFNQGGIHN